VAGRLASWNVDLGSRVGAGSVLAELDARDYELRRDRARAALEQARARLGLPVGGDDDGLDPQSVGVVRQAKARLEQARLTLERSRELRDQGILAQADYDTSQAAFKVAESLYNDSLEEVNNRRGILAERRSDLALAEQQLTDSRWSRLSRARCSSGAPTSASTWPPARRCSRSSSSRRCGCGSTCPSARRSDVPRGPGRRGPHRRERPTPGRAASSGSRPRSKRRIAR
jgi:hypothetical protein